MNFLKSIGAVLAGMVFIVITHTVTDKILEASGIFPPPEQGLHVTWMLLLASAYRTAFSIAGSYIAAKLAPSRPMAHALAIGAIGVILSTLGAVMANQMDLSPMWYPILLIILSLPIAWLGGRLATRRP